MQDAAKAALTEKFTELRVLLEKKRDLKSLIYTFTDTRMTLENCHSMTLDKSKVYLWHSERKEIIVVTAEINKIKNNGKKSMKTIAIALKRLIKFILFQPNDEQITAMDRIQPIVCFL